MGSNSASTIYMNQEDNGNVQIVANEVNIYPNGRTNDLVTDSQVNPLIISLPARFKNNSDINNWLPYASSFFDESPHYYSGYGGQGVIHINEILKYIDALIPITQKISDKFTFFLIAGVILHDIGRQLTQEGFAYLLESPSWKKKWREYLLCSCRFSDAEQINRFGETLNVIELFRNGSAISTEETVQHKLVIRDFIREWHGYIAYEVAKNNRDLNSKKNIFNFEIGADFQDLIGCIAQSHKMPLRSVEPLIENTRYGGWGANKPFGVPVFYLMALLRIADYFDAKHQFHRNSFNELNAEQLSLNKIVGDITFPPNTPHTDSVFIHACPYNTRTFVITKEWIETIQYELDYSWAVLCEKYGSDCAFTIHRVYSNITDETAVAAFQKDFVTDKAFLKADTNILKHLISPLYGNDASYGVRELTANAIDAVNERAYASNSNSQEKPIEYKIEVRISECESLNKKRSYVFSIIDTGIGMTLDVILNYYLTSGVSFRESEEWRRLFSKGKKVSVVRTGRFGVGALSAFLIGDTITVTTRHMDEKNKGFKFTFSLGSEIINIERVDCEIGTKIEIPITNERYILAMMVVPQYLKQVGRYMSKSSSALIRIGGDLNDEESVQYTGFGCFRYPKPEIIYNYCGENINVQFNKVPRKIDIKRNRFSDWYAFENDDYFVAWKPSAFSPHKQVRYFCNGFRFSSVINNIGKEYGCDMGNPIFSAEDALGVFVCDLARDKISLPADFILELFRYKISLLFGLDVMKTLRSKNQ